MSLKLTESQIQCSICEYLERKRRFFSRVNNIPVFDPKRKTFRALPKYTRKGFPDIIVFHNGDTICLEVKAPKGMLSQDQKLFKADCEKHRIEYYVVRSIEDVIEIGL